MMQTDKNIPTPASQVQRVNLLPFICTLQGTFSIYNVLSSESVGMRAVDLANVIREIN